jgi:hypothetical protein
MVLSWRAVLSGIGVFTHALKLGQVADGELR